MFVASAIFKGNTVRIRGLHLPAVNRFAAILSENGQKNAKASSAKDEAFAFFIIVSAAQRSVLAPVLLLFFVKKTFFPRRQSQYFQPGLSSSISSLYCSFQRTLTRPYCLRKRRAVRKNIKIHRRNRRRLRRKTNPFFVVGS